jgi:hypothetical protein
MTSIAVYCALMKVYAYCGFHVQLAICTQRSPRAASHPTEDVGARLSNVVPLLSFAYWSLDVILSFFMPYERDGVHISHCPMTSFHYVQRSFILDLHTV